VKARGALVATLLGVLLLSALYPLRQYASQDSHVAGLVRQEHALSKQITDLKRQQELLNSDDEIERVAREDLGMVRPGEVAFAVVPEGSSAAASRAAAGGSRTDGAAAHETETWFARWWGAVVGAFRGMH
jgi:cell division protein FtsB